METQSAWHAQTDEELKKRKTKPSEEKQSERCPDHHVQRLAGGGGLVCRTWKKAAPTPTPEIRAKAQELVQGKTAELDKMAALYNYVAQNIRYVSLSFGLGRFQPH